MQNIMPDKPPGPGISPDRLRIYSSELRIQSPRWADRLEQVRTERELGDLICDLFNLSHAILPERHPSPEPDP